MRERKEKSFEAFQITNLHKKFIELFWNVGGLDNVVLIVKYRGAPQIVDSPELLR